MAVLSELLVLLCLVFGASGQSASSLLRGKTIYQSTVRHSWINSTDGNLNTWSVTEVARFPWIVVDMGALNTITSALVYNDPDDNTVPYLDVMVGTYFNPCEGYQLSTFTLCGRIQINLNNVTSKVVCSSAVTGQFVMFKYNTPNDTTSDFLKISVAEVEAYGTKGSTTGIQTSPVLSLLSSALPTLSSLFSASAVILAGTTSVTLPYGVGEIYFGNSNSEAILYDATYFRPAMVATQYGKGRMLTLGNHDWLITIRTSTSQAVLWKAMQAWLRAGSLASLTGSVRNATDAYNTGDIVIIEGYISSLTASQVSTLISKLNAGSISVIHAISGWKLSTQLEMMPQFALCNATGVYITIDQITWSSQSWTVNSSPSLNVLPLETVLNTALTTPYILGQVTPLFTNLRDYHAYQMGSFNLSTLATSVINKYKDYVRYNQPCLARPITDVTGVGAFVYGFNQLSLTPLLAGSNYKAPGIVNFPGDFDSPPPTKAKKLQFIAYLKTEFHPTGLYLPAGTTLNFTITAITGSAATDWNIRVGCHDDNVGKTSTWQRFPLIFVTRSLDYGQVFSPFGGIIWIQSTVVNSSVTISFPSAVETPFFNLRDSANVANFNSRKSSPGLWADIAGDAMIVCIPSYLVRDKNSTYATALMRDTFDKMVKLDYDMIGEDWRYELRQRAVMDLEIEAGYGHSGYPIMGTLDWADDMFNATYIQSQGTWGMCHETGHNMQNSLWTWSGTGETTVNIFCMFNYVMLFNLPLSITSVLDSDTIAASQSYFASGATPFNAWYNNVWLGLAIYYEVGVCFGWGIYKQVFSNYPASMVDTSSTQSKIDIWMYALSNATGKNLMPMFDFWGFNITASVAQSVSSLPCILPSDTFTNLNSTWAAKIRTKYANKCTSSCSPMTYPNPPAFTPMLPNDVIDLS